MFTTTSSCDELLLSRCARKGMDVFHPGICLLSWSTVVH
jgi:hypothetical protein